MAVVQVASLRHVRLCSAAAKPLAAFYEAALGFRVAMLEHLSGARAREHFGVPGRALRVTLELGAQRVVLVLFVDQPGRSYPRGSDAADPVFQHIAIVVGDMAGAMLQLAGTPGWTPITRGGPQQLPASSGGVTAFKFRDPEGHPLELLAFPADNTPMPWQGARGHGPFLGIDHSAISVADSARSVAFYAALGLTAAHCSLNEDPAQARLDGLASPVVEVTAMAPAFAPPHVELLSYRQVMRREGHSNDAGSDLAPNDVAATCLVFTGANGRGRPGHDRVALVDPDGHHLAVDLTAG
jgi:catechol 2,3-dioxygenase-like lactoylglutathione lyase family enzyme